MEFTSLSFYITLLSNACKSEYPSNSAGKYKARLARPIQLKHDYEVALSEIQYPRTWATLNGSCNKVWYNDGTGFREACIDQGYYPNIEAIINQIDKAINKNVNDGIILQYNSITRQVNSYIKANYAPRLQEGLAQILGLPSLEVISKTMIAPYSVDINRGLTALYVYCDLCEPQLVGDTLAPLLRIVDSKGKDGQNIVKFYGQPHFVPLRKKYINVTEFIYLGFYIAFNTVQVLSRRVVGRAEETSTYSLSGFCTVNC